MESRSLQVCWFLLFLFQCFISLKICSIFHSFHWFCTGQNRGESVNQQYHLLWCLTIVVKLCCSNESEILVECSRQGRKWCTPPWMWRTSSRSGMRRPWRGSSSWHCSCPWFWCSSFSSHQAGRGLWKFTCKTPLKVHEGLVQISERILFSFSRVHVVIKGTQETKWKFSWPKLQQVCLMGIANALHTVGTFPALSRALKRNVEHLCCTCRTMFSLQKVKPREGFTLSVFSIPPGLMYGYYGLWYSCWSLTDRDKWFGIRTDCEQMLELPRLPCKQ